MTDKPSPTDEQITILDHIRSSDENLIIKALAGTGKTTTLEFIQAATKIKPILYVCFNKRIAEEAKTKFPSTTSIKTLNGLGHGIWGKACSRKLNVSLKKTSEHFKALVSSAPKNTQRVLWDSYWDVCSGVGMAKAIGYVPDGKFPQAKRLISKEDFYPLIEGGDDELTQDLIDELLLQSIKSAYEGYIDFDDQVYMPALFGGSFPRFPFNFVDEGQDLNPVNHVMLDKLVKSRLCLVGDEYQSIYAFRGAVQGGMRTLQDRFQMASLDLSVSFRCRRVIVENARWRAPHYQWMKEGGHVEQLKQLDARTIPDGLDDKEQPTTAIICRNNAPLFRCALQLLASGRSVKVVGSDIGPRVVAIMRELGDEDDSRAKFEASIDEWLSEKLVKAKSNTARDIADCMRVFAEHGNTLGQSVAYAQHLMAQEGKIQLLTGHKSKGMEYGTVFHLDPFLIDEDKGGEQEANLRYVIQTRAKDTYYEIDSRAIDYGG